jgi:hypothetical protein
VDVRGTGLFNVKHLVLCVPSINDMSIQHSTPSGGVCEFSQLHW